jgi:hypothetical protein
LNLKCKHWIDLRELPDENQHKEQSYIRFKDIERVSFVETGHQEYKIYVTALGAKFLYNIVNTEHEALSLSKNLIDDIEFSESVKN